MRTGTFDSQGMAPAVCWHAGQFAISWQSWNPTTKLQDADLGIDGKVSPIAERVIGTGAGAFVRLVSVNGQLLRAARWGDEHDQLIVLERDGIVVWRSPYRAGGNWPCVLDFDYGTPYWCREVTPSGPQPVYVGINETSSTAPGTGIVPGGIRPWVTWNDNYASEPGMFCPDRAGGWVVGHRRDANGVLVRFGAKEVVLWPDLATPEPHCALSADGSTLCVVVASQPDGLVRWALVTEADLAEPEPVPPPQPGLVVFDPAGGPWDWPRLSSQFPGRQMHCQRFGRYVAFIKAPRGIPCEVWELGESWSRLRQDTPGEGRAEGYAYRLKYGYWVPMRPGNYIGHRFVWHDEIQWLDKPGGEWGPWFPFSYAITVTRADHERVEWDYEPGLNPETVEHYVVVVGNGWNSHFPKASPEAFDAWPEKGGVPVWLPDVALAFLDAEDEPETPYVPVEGTIVEPERWPVKLTAPAGTQVGVRCVAKVTAGECDGIRWQRYGVGAWWNEHDWQSPNDTDHTFLFSAALVISPSPGDVVVETPIRCQFRDLTGYVHTTGRERIIRVTWQAQPEPPQPPEPPSPGWTPTRDEVRNWNANFLCFPEFEFAFMYLAWDDEKQRRFRETYGGKHTHLPLSVWGRYPGHGEYITPMNLEAEMQVAFDDLAAARQLPSFVRELAVVAASRRISALFGLAGYRYRDDMPAFAEKLRELLDAKIIPCVFTITDELDGSDVTMAEAKAMVDKLATIPDVIHATSLGWEINQIAGGWGNGAQQLELARYIAEKLPDAVRYVHFSPERITGYPNYPDHSGPQDEPQWWREARCTPDVPWEQRILHGILYQRSPDEPEPYVLAHTIGGTSQDGSTDIGDVNRLRPGGTWGMAADFVFFEHSREIGRWTRLVDAVKADGRCHGWG